jgi:hypothetical protein
MTEIGDRARDAAERAKNTRRLQLGEGGSTIALDSIERAICRLEATICICTEELLRALRGESPSSSILVERLEDKPD